MIVTAFGHGAVRKVGGIARLARTVLQKTIGKNHDPRLENAEAISVTAFSIKSKLRHPRPLPDNQFLMLDSGTARDEPLFCAWGAQKMTISRPDIPRHHADRFDACQTAIEDELIELVGRAHDRGWHTDEVLGAIMAVADNLALARREDLAIAIEMRVRQMIKNREA
ncbi:MAG: hypothetical protein AAAB35_23045 [Phyllobacterium sp.]|uniref:hypothetical protein n=1 Tax=Phyllobacterium sp. TaxID=1871046 RepID=UPI0030F242B2